MKHKTQLVVIFILEQSIYKDPFILLTEPIPNIQFSDLYFGLGEFMLF
jgi:hypothetical protein